jgi:hypothetical protein
MFVGQAGAGHEKSPNAEERIKSLLKQKGILKGNY